MVSLENIGIVLIPAHALLVRVSFQFAQLRESHESRLGATQLLKAICALSYMLRGRKWSRQWLHVAFKLEFGS